MVVHLASGPLSLTQLLCQYSSWLWADLSDTIRHQWLRNLPGDSPAQPDSRHGHGEWLHCLPGKWETALLDPVFRLGLSQRLGYPAPGTGQQCGRTPPGGKQCQHILDPYGRHAACCTKGLYTRRHDRIRDLTTKLARQAGLTATNEQAMLIPDQKQEDGQLAPGSVRPIHRADIHFIEPQGSELWLDVKIHTVTPDLVVTKELLREELAKCRAYGQRDGFNLQTLDRGMIPVVLEQFGRTAPGAQAIFYRIINHRLQILVRQGTPFSFAKRAQLRAVGSNIVHAAPSSLASSCGVCPSNRPGRIRRHTPQLAKLPRGVPVSSMSA